MSTRLVVVLSGVLALCSCGTPRYTYAPVRVTSADVAGQAAAMYPVPPEDPLGDVRVTTFGMARLFPEDDDGAPVWAIHVALTSPSVSRSNGRTCCAGWCSPSPAAISMPRSHRRHRPRSHEGPRQSPT